MADEADEADEAYAADAADAADEADAVGTRGRWSWQPIRATCGATAAVGGRTWDRAGGKEREKRRGKDEGDESSRSMTGGGLVWFGL